MSGILELLLNLCAVFVIGFALQNVEARNIRVVGFVPECLRNNWPRLTESKVSEDGCLNACASSANCKLAVYRMDLETCGLVDAGWDCKFKRFGFSDPSTNQTKEPTVILGISSRSFVTLDDIQYDSSQVEPMKIGGKLVVYPRGFVKEEACSNLCSLTPACRVAFLDGFEKGQSNCVFYNKTASTTKLDPELKGHTKAFVF